MVINYLYQYVLWDIMKGKRKEWDFSEGENKTFIHPRLKLSTKMKKNGNYVLITYKDMFLSVTEADSKGNQKQVERHKYVLGDIGLQKYSRRIKEYMSKGYEIDSSTGNMEEILKEMKKAGP